MFTKISDKIKKFDRKKLLRKPLQLSGTGIEYGPLHHPIVTKDMSDVKYVDFASTEDLRRQYSSSTQVAPETIVDVDIVTGGERIVHFVAPESVDYIVASHVAEHVPDFISWMEDNLSILKPGGRLSLACPDKRFCFDMKRNSSTVPDFLAAWLERRTAPSMTQICDFYYNQVQTTAQEAWDKTVTPENAKHIMGPRQVLKILRNKTKDDEYVNVHCWVFTDEEFRSLLDTQLRPFLSIPYRVLSFHPTRYATNEFFICVEKSR